MLVIYRLSFTVLRRTCMLTDRVYIYRWFSCRRSTMAAAGGWQQHRIPAFGDWNYNYPHDGVEDWPAVVTPLFDFAPARRTAARPVDQQKCNKVNYYIVGVPCKQDATGFRNNIFFKFFYSLVRLSIQYTEILAPKDYREKIKIS